MSRIDVFLDYPHTAMYGEGFGFTKLSGNLKFAERKSLSDGSGGTVSELVPVGTPKDFEKVPGLGVITLAPRFQKIGVVDYDDPASDVYKESEVDVTTNDDGSAALRLYKKTGTWAITRPGPGFSLISLLVDIAVQAILATASVTLRVAWRTKTALKADEGFYLQVIPVRMADDPRSQGYMLLNFGQKFGLGINLQGTAELYENVGTASAPQIVSRRKFDVSGTGVDLTKNFIVSVQAIGGRYILIRFGNVRFRGSGARLTSYLEQRDFVFDVNEEGSGNEFDSALDKFVCIPAAKWSISLNASGTDYRFVPGKIRFDTEGKTALFTGEPMNGPLPGQTPEVTPFGFASGYSQGGQGSMSLDYTGATGAAWNDDTDDTICPSLTMAASSDGIYSPELWWIEGNVYPLIYTPPYTPFDASGIWHYIRFQRSALMEPCITQVKLTENSRADRIMQRGGPYRIQIDEEPVADGYFKSRKPTLGFESIETEAEGNDMQSRLKVPIGKFQSQDGKTLASLVFRILRRCGFQDDQIVIVDNLHGITIEQFSDAQSLKIYTATTLAEEALKDLAERYAVQGKEPLSVRWNGVAWVCQMVPIGSTPADPENPDPALVFSSDDRVGPKGPDADRWAEGWFHITSALELDVVWPAYNALGVTGTQAAGEGGGKYEAFIPPHPDVLNNPDSQMFEGLLRVENKSTPEVLATTKGGVDTYARVTYDQETRKVVGLGVQAEYQKEIDCEMECAVVGRNPATGATTSFGVWSIEAFDAEIAHDEGESVETGVYLLSHTWSAAYRLRYLRPTTAAFGYGAVTIPMYGGLLPEVGQLTQGGGSES